MDGDWDIPDFLQITFGACGQSRWAKKTKYVRRVVEILDCHFGDATDVEVGNGIFVCAALNMGRSASLAIL